MKLHLLAKIKPVLHITLWLFLIVGLSACSPIIPVDTPVQTPEPQATPTRRTPVPKTQPVRTPTSTAEPPSVIDITAEELRGSVIRFWHNWPGAPGEVITALVEDFNLNNPWGILAVEIYQGNLDEIDEKLDVVGDKADRPDLVVGYLHQALDWDAKIGLVDLDDYLLDPIWGYSADEVADFNPVFLQHDLSRDKRLGIPAQRSGQILFYNQTWAQELGFSAAPLSSDNFMEQACEAARQNQLIVKDGTGGWVISTEYPAIFSWMVAFGGVVFQDEPSVAPQGVFRFDQPDVLQTYEFLRGMYDNGCAWMPENPYPETYFAERKALFASGSITDIPYFLDAMRRTGNNDQWTVLAYPGPEGTQVVDVYGTSFVLLKSTEQQQLAAWLLLKWLLQPENQARLVQTTYAFPLRLSEIQHLAQSGSAPLAWVAGLNLLEFAQAEPPSRSWSLVRWAISDSATQLFRSYTTMEQVPALVRYLDQTTEDLLKMVDENE